MIDANVPEKPDLQDFLRDHPWLVDQTWTMLEHERRLDTLLVRHISRGGRVRRGSSGGRNRVDYFCLADASRVVVVEVKRPDFTASKRELHQLSDYVEWVRKKEGQTNDPERPARSVSGYLVAGRLHPDATGERDRLHTDQMFFRTWEQMLRTARESHRDFFDIVKKRAPKGDPRIEALSVEPGPVSAPRRQVRGRRAKRKMGKA
jgi:RecB family endonuclease NucS